MPSARASVPAQAPAALGRLLELATAQITRHAPAEARAAADADADAVIIDIRAQDARQRDGVIPGSLHIPRTVLEWRVALESPWRNPHLAGPDQRLIVICDHGYSSILAAANLVALGFHHAGDVIGGFEAWNERGLPVAEWHAPTGLVNGLPGTGPLE